MKNLVSAFREVASGACAPRSVRAISASLANPWQMACAGARHAQKYITAIASGGLSAPKPQGVR